MKVASILIQPMKQCMPRVLLAMTSLRMLRGAVHQRIERQLQAMKGSRPQQPMPAFAYSIAGRIVCKLAMRCSRAHCGRHRKPQGSHWPPVPPIFAVALTIGAHADLWRAACVQDAERRAAVVQQRAEQVRKELNPLNSPLVQKYFQK